MGALEYLEGERGKQMGGVATKIQAAYRGFRVRNKTQGDKNRRNKAGRKILKWYKERKAMRKRKEAAKKQRKDMLKKMEAEKKSRAKAEEKAKKARDSRLATEKKEREEKEAKEKAEREAKELKEKKEKEKRDKKEQEANDKFEKDKKKKIEKYTKKIKEKEKELNDKEKQWERDLASIDTDAEAAEKERDEVLEQIAKEEAKAAAVPHLSDKEKSKLEQSAEIVAYLRKENKKLRSSTTQLRKDFDAMQENNKRLLEANAYAGASFEAMSEKAKKNNSNNSKLMQNLEKYKQQNKRLQEDLRMRQSFFDAEAQIRVNYQKAMAQIMEMIQDQCDDAQLTEDILVLALECESEAKSELAAAEGY